MRPSVSCSSSRQDCQASWLSNWVGSVAFALVIMALISCRSASVSDLAITIPLLSVDGIRWMIALRRAFLELGPPGRFAPLWCRCNVVEAHEPRRFQVRIHVRFVAPNYQR